MEYKINIKNQLLLIYPCLISITSYSLIAICLLICVNEIYVAILILWIIMFVICDLRSILYHIDYWLKNKDITLTINENNTIVYKNSNEESIQESIKDIKFIEIHKPRFENQGWISYKYYYHYKVFFNDGKTMIITSMLVKNLELPCYEKITMRRFLPFKY